MILYSLLLALFGLTMIFLEFFVPGGILAVLGAMAILAGTMLLSLWGPGWNVAGPYLIVCLMLTALTCYIAIRRIKKSGKKDSFYHSKDQEGYVPFSLSKKLIGKKGVAASDLKPSGHVLIEGDPFQAVSERGYITKDTEIQVISLGSAYLIVKPIKESL